MRVPLCGAAPAGREVVRASCVALGRSVVFAGAWFCAAVRAWRVHAAGCVDFAPSTSRITDASSRRRSAALRGAADARAVMRRVASGARSGVRVLCRARAQRRVCGCVVLRGSARVAGTHGRVRWLCPICTPHNLRIQPTASLAALARGG